MFDRLRSSSQSAPADLESQGNGNGTEQVREHLFLAIYRLGSVHTCRIHISRPAEGAGQWVWFQTARVTDLSWETRVYCFLGCFILSMVCSILGSPFMFAGKVAEFAVMVSLGAVISIGG